MCMCIKLYLILYDLHTEIEGEFSAKNGDTQKKLRYNVKCYFFWKMNKYRQSLCAHEVGKLPYIWCQALECFRTFTFHTFF